MKRGDVNENLEIFNVKYMDMFKKIEENEDEKQKLIDHVNDLYWSPKELICFCKDELSRISDGSNVLILGGGYGGESHRFKLAYGKCNLYSLDLSPWGSRVGNEITKNVNFVTGDMCDIDFEDDFFDVIFSLHSLEHTSDIDQTMNEIYRLIKNGGLFGLAYPYKWQLDEQHVYMFEDDIIEYMSKFGKVEGSDSIEHQSKMLKIAIEKEEQ